MSSWGTRAKGALLRVALRALGATWRLRDDLPDDCRAVIEGRVPGVIAFWHGKMFPLWYRFRGRGFSALISASRDGGLLASYLERSLGYRDLVRGSSSKGGSEALAEMVERLKGGVLLVTPDGPRGPSREGKPGALIAAARTGAPVILAGWSCRRSFTFNSWDAMQLPIPFSRVNFRYCKFEFDESDRMGKEEMRKEEWMERMRDATREGEDEVMEGMSDAIRDERPGLEGAPDLDQVPELEGTMKKKVIWIDDEMLRRFNDELNRIS